MKKTSICTPVRRRAQTFVGLALLFGCATHKLKEPAEPLIAASTVIGEAYDCDAAAEFSTALSFLRVTKGLELSEAPARQLALEVTAGCTGAAGRFIEVTELLLRAGVDARHAVEIGRDVAAQPEDAAKAYRVMFKLAFAQDSLDMNLKEALALARTLTIDFPGNRTEALKDFEELVEFCVRAGSKGLDLPRPACGALAARVTLAGARVREEIGEAFVEAFEYLTEDNDGPRLTTVDAIKVAEGLVSISPLALDNFVDAYEFATAKSGLDLERSAAVLMASRVAEGTVAKIEVPR